MGDHQDDRAVAGALAQAGPDPAAQLDRRLPSLTLAIVAASAAGGGVPRIASLNLGRGQSDPTADIDFPQAVVDQGGLAEPDLNGGRRLPGAPQWRADDLIRLPGGHGRRGGGRLSQAFVIQRDVGVAALKAVTGVPRGQAVAPQDEGGCRRLAHSIAAIEKPTYDRDGVGPR